MGDQEVTRHITRSIEPVQLFKEDKCERDWYWVLDSFVRPLRRSIPVEACPLKDTIVFENGVPTSWVYGGAGEMVLRAQKQCTLGNIRKKFRNLGEGRVCVTVSRDNRIACMTTQELLEFTNWSSIQSLQFYVEPKGGESAVYDTNPSNYRHEYALQVDGRPQTSSFRLGAPTATNKMGETQRESIRSRNSDINNAMDEVVLGLVRTLEKNQRCRILKLKTDFIVDRNDHPWLVHAYDIVTTEERLPDEFVPTRVDQYTAPTNFLDRRRQQTLQNEKLLGEKAEEEHTLRDWGLAVDAGLTEIADYALSKTGRRVRGRKRARTDRKMKAECDSNSHEDAPTEEASSSSVGVVLNSSFKVGPSNRPGSPSSTTIPFSSTAIRNMNPHALLASLDVIDPAKLISEKLDKAGAGNMLHSSQKGSVCPGDFCHIILDIDMGEDDGSYLTSAQKAKAALDEMDPEDTEHVPPPPSGEDLKCSTSYKSIVQARAERRLVELLIKRMQKKETGEYVQSIGDLEANSLAKDYPIHYYRQVKVCERCFKLYSKIEDARQRALLKFDPQHNEMERKLQALKTEQKQTKLSDQLHEGGGKKITFAAVDQSFKDKRVHPFSKEGQKLMEQSFQELQKLANMRAQQAIRILTKADLAEFRSFQNPPHGVIQVSQALMMLLTGKLMTWEASKRIMSNGERFLAMLLEFESDLIPPHRLADLEQFVRDPEFRPTFLKRICKSAAVFCEYILGNVQAKKYQTGQAHPRSDPLLFLSESDRFEPSELNNTKKDDNPFQDDEVMTETEEKEGLTENGSFMVQIPQYLQNHFQRAQNLRTIKRSSVEAAPLENKLEQQRRLLKTRETSSTPSLDATASTPTGRKRKGKRPRSTEGGEVQTVTDVAPPPSAGDLEIRELNLTDLPDAEYNGKDGEPAILSPKGFSRAQHRALSGTRVAFNRHESLRPASRPGSRQISTSSTTSSNASASLMLQANGNTFLPLNGFADSQQAADLLRKKLEDEAKNESTKKKLTRQQLRARRKMQERQMERLHGHVRPDPNEESATAATHGKMFSCSDNTTVLPYEVVGVGGLEGNTPNLVIIHDLFDTYESLQIFLEPILRRYQSSQALVFNYAGQAYTSFPDETQNVLNNAFHAATLHELLTYVEAKGEFSCSIKPFYLVGIGNGANIATYFASEYASSLNEYKYNFRGLVSVNGFSFVDEQLAAILHSSVNVFSCSPPNRPDLPITYFTRFLFSDSYLKELDPCLVLNLYTAVSNPISLQGRVQLCDGALHHKDTRNQLRELKVPIVVIQSTQNILVNPTNVDPFVEGRDKDFLWSHQIPKDGKLAAKQVAKLKSYLDKADGTFVIWLDAGHELKQEAKPHLRAVLEQLLSNCSQKSFGGPRRKVSKPNNKPNTSNTPPNSDGADGNTKKRKAKKKKRKSNHRSEESKKDEDEEQQLGKGDHKEDRSTTEAKSEENYKDDDEFEQVMRRHREAKRQAEEARQARIRERQEFEKKILQEQEKLKQAQLRMERERLEQEEKQRIQYEQEMERSRMEQEQKLQKLLDEKQQEMLSQVESERAKAEQLQAKLQQELMQQKQEQEKLRAKMAKAAKEEGVTEDRLRESLKASGLNYERIVQHKEQQQQHDVQETKVALDDDVMDVRYHIELLKREQEERRRKWEEEDRRRIAMLEEQLLNRSKGYSKRADAHMQFMNQYHVEDADETPKHDVSMRLSMMNDNDQPSNLSVDDVADVGENVDVAESSSHDGVISEQDMLTNAMKEAERLEKSAILSQQEQGENVQLMDLDEYEKVRQELVSAEEERLAKEEEEFNRKRNKIEHAKAIEIQRICRGRLGRARFRRIQREKQSKDVKYMAATRIQAAQRGKLGRKRALQQKEVVLRDRQEKEAIQLLQRVMRGMLGRKKALIRKREHCAIILQKVGRRYNACCEADRRRAERDRIIREKLAATKIQSVWRMFQGREQYMHQRILQLAATQIQRVYRGCRGRRKAERKKTWKNAEPGPERLQLGLSLIEESKAAFEAQQEEIDALHRAQERAETRVSKIHAGLQESEKELAILEQELRDVDQLDEALHQLSHEKALQEAKAEAEERIERQQLGSKYDGNSEAARKRAAESYALEMQIHIKRAERERKKKELEAEFSAVFHEVETKKNELRHLEENIHDMEATRKRKEREFQRLQRNLMELLQEQKNELDSLRERGIELEVATATSAAAAAATAAAAKENEERSRQMFNSTEELLKFQFMSMSLSYFSSMNMLKSLRDINSDTTQAAISSSADTAAAAAAAAQAANIPSLMNSMVGAGGGNPSNDNNAVAQSKLKQKQAEIERQKEMEEARKSLEVPFPEDMRKWTVQDVLRWLDTLSLGQYKAAFQEACIDGEFLIELRVEDMRDILGMKHQLHVQKLDLARRKLRPLDMQEQKRKEAVEWEAEGEKRREEIQKQTETELVPDASTVFSQIRNGRYNRVEKALDLGFDANETDSHGNTALIVAAQNLNKRICELLLNRGANVNHQNSQGNTAMHYAMAYEPEGNIGEFLIGRGADDSIVSKLGLTPYDGIE